MDKRKLFKTLTTLAVVGVARGIANSAAAKRKTGRRQASANASAGRFDDFDEHFTIFEERVRGERSSRRAPRATSYVVEAREKIDIDGESEPVCVIGEDRIDVAIETSEAVTFGDGGDEEDVVVERGLDRLCIGSSSTELVVRVPRTAHVRVHASCAAIEVANVASIDCVAHEEIVVRGVTGTTRVFSEHGDAEVDVPDGWHGETIDVEAEHGAVQITLPASGAFDVDAGSEHGEVDAPSGGSGAYVRASSEYGDVDVKRRA